MAGTCGGYVSLTLHALWGGYDNDYLPGIWEPKGLLLGDIPNCKIVEDEPRAGSFCQVRIGNFTSC
jgi:hypothetical protein